MPDLREELRQRDVLADMLIEHWRVLWQDPDVRTEDPDHDSVAYFLAELSEEVVSRGMEETQRRIPAGGHRPVAYLYGLLHNRRRESWSAAARTFWIVEMLCPSCDSFGLTLTLRSRRPRSPVPTAAPA